MLTPVAVMALQDSLEDAETSLIYVMEVSPYIVKGLDGGQVMPLGRKQKAFINNSL
jgi:hypothetical protein